MRTRTLALAGIIGPAWFTTLVVVQGLLLPDYSHVRMPISALSAWPTGWIQNLNFYVTGSLAIVFAVVLHSGVQSTPRGFLGVGLLVLSGGGVILAGIFPWKMVDGVPTETPPHVVGAISAFAGTGLGLVVFARRMSRDPRWRSFSRYTLFSGIAVLFLFVTLGLFAIDDGAPLHSWVGLIQRVLCTVWFGWMVVMAIWFRMVRADPSRGA